jgi:hypothetical protein
VQSASARAPNITISNNSGGPVQTSTGSNGDVTVTIDRIIDAAVGKSLATGAGRRVLNSSYGMEPFTGQ